MFAERYFKLSDELVPSQTIVACVDAGNDERFGSLLPKPLIAAASVFVIVPPPQANQSVSASSQRVLNELAMSRTVNPLGWAASAAVWKAPPFTEIPSVGQRPVHDDGERVIGVPADRSRFLYSLRRPACNGLDLETRVSVDVSPVHVVERAVAQHEKRQTGSALDVRPLR
jgi:hypothetical protein